MLLMYIMYRHCCSKDGAKKATLARKTVQIRAYRSCLMFVHQARPTKAELKGADRRTVFATPSLLLGDGSDAWKDAFCIECWCKLSMLDAER